MQSLSPLALRTLTRGSSGSATSHELSPCQVGTVTLARYKSGGYRLTWNRQPTPNVTMGDPQRNLAHAQSYKVVIDHLLESAQVVLRVLPSRVTSSPGMVAEWLAARAWCGVLLALLHTLMAAL